MKKILIASTALVAAGLLTSGAASASEKIKLELGGYSKWWVVGQWNDSKYQAISAANKDFNNVDVKGDNEVFFSGETTLDNGVKVGINIELEAGGDKGASNSSTQDTIDQSFVYVAGGFGKVIIGTAANGTVLLHNMAPDAAGNWGSENIAFQAVSQPTNSAPRLTTEIDTDDNAEKITYVAPTFYGLTVGATYVPNSSEDNRGVTNIKKEVAGDIYGVGALYAKSFGGVDLKVSAGYVTYAVESTDGSTTIAGKTNVNEYSTGTQIAYNGFTLGGSYRKVNAAAAVNVVESTVWDAGLQYASGPYAISFAHLSSKEGISSSEDKVELNQVSGKYTLGAGVDVLATLAQVDWKADSSSAASNNNKGYTAMTGLSLAF